MRGAHGSTGLQEYKGRINEGGPWVQGFTLTGSIRVGVGPMSGVHGSRGWQEYEGW